MSNIINGLAYGLPVMAIGLVIVFLALVILIATIWLLGKVVSFFATSAEKKKAAAAAPAPAPAPAPVVEEVVEEEVVNDDEIIAVIAAAIACFDQTNAKLVVRSIRRKSGWGKASREEQVYRF